MRWPAAGAALGTAVLHAVSATTSGPTGFVALVMTLTCVVCAAHLVARPYGAAWAQATVMSAAMLVAHPVFLLTGGHGHHAPAGPAVGLLGWGLVLAPALSLTLGFYGFAVSRSLAR